MSADPDGGDYDAVYTCMSCRYEITSVRGSMRKRELLLGQVGSRRAGPSKKKASRQSWFRGNKAEASPKPLIDGRHVTVAPLQAALRTSLCSLAEHMLWRCIRKHKHKAINGRKRS
jgi:hypothetical protein